MKVHVGCGTVFLEGYRNVDVRAPGVFLASERPDLVEKYKTTDSDYYGRHKDKTIESMRSGPKEQDYVCDEFATFFDLPGSSGTLDEVLARHSFEHLSITEADKALIEIERKLKPGGILRLDVPDHEGTLQEFKKTGDEFYIRHLLGPRRGDYGYHMMSYTRERLRGLVESHGLKFVCEEANIHVYPSFCLRFYKPGVRPAWEYFSAEILKHIGTYKSILEVGPGRFPFPLASHYADISQNHLDDTGKNKSVCFNWDIGKKLPDGHPTFDFVYAAHVLEHLDNPLHGVEALSKLAPRGIIIVPSILKDALFNFEEEDHKFWFIPTGSNSLEGYRINRDVTTKLRLLDMQKAMTRLVRTGPNVCEDQRIVRNWYYDHEKDLDILLYWEGIPRIVLR